MPFSTLQRVRHCAPAGTAFSLILCIAVLAGCDADQDDPKTARVMTQVMPTSAPGSEVTGRAVLSTAGGEDDSDMITISGTLEGLSPGEHGIHLHANATCADADTDDDGEAEPAGGAGPHYDRNDSGHGAPDDAPDERHYGDLGNVTADESGMAEFEIMVRRPEGIIVSSDLGGRALVVHEDADDFETDPGGNAGARIACGTL